MIETDEQKELMFNKWKIDFPGGSDGKDTAVQSQDWGDPLEPGGLKPNKTKLFIKKISHWH